MVKKYKKSESNQTYYEPKNPQVVWKFYFSNLQFL